MPLFVSCGDCQRDFKMPIEASGKKAKCPFCGEVNDVPMASRPARAWQGLRWACAWIGHALDRALLPLPRGIAGAYRRWTVKTVEEPVSSDAHLSGPNVRVGIDSATSEIAANLNRATRKSEF